ncbi:glycosyltransferase [Algoriphagus boritolerans]|uniref:Glycosyltransferase, catalytic subunit of cellulose synthase and poly-beta-1,6-N-acetylglucosamine synthase n=1 Tax=Algoriphagus boritolerans DSM 17298 = JCM 18970 TaxID=1120964 RepID=A0A1H6A0U9_9BACT|nr:glycosyltransferase [Algoriphagus boritolerans]SEG42071.1 Glycosyltransferase, catalytic subunit of cellulose synthase and poly-beta-1,6-N-acetylglucosamine synthase [Algoriphagus boritolerans DSM 17298 = JCM 18970]
MISFYLLWTGCYVVLLSRLSEKWLKFKPKATISKEFPSVTLLIPFRNELGNLPDLVKEFSKIDYSELRIILVDDHSEDGSFDFLLEKFHSDHRVRILQSPGVGKKEAIEFGLDAADSELILCSDADCSFSKVWVKEMVTPFSDPKVQFVAGPVISIGRTHFFQRFQQIEWSSILLLTQYFFSQKRPLMCSGANLCYRKSAFEAVQGYDQNRQHLSGDDEFLLKKISAHFGGQSCVYLPFLENLVYTKPQESFSSLLNQRIRWAGKWKVHRDLVHALSAFFSFLIQVIWVGTVFLLSLGSFGVLTFFTVWAVKVLSERRTMGKVLRGFELDFSLIDFLKTGIIHPIYVIFVGLGAVRGKFTWKGRSN